MRTKLPDCPRCGDIGLWLWRTGDTFRLKCVECGWSTGEVTLATGEELNEIIAQKVEAARSATMPPELK